MINDLTAEQRTALLAIIDLLPAALGLDRPGSTPIEKATHRRAAGPALPPLRPEPLDTPGPLPEPTDGTWRTHYSVREVAAGLQLPLARVRTMIRDDQLHTGAGGLITRASLAAWLERRPSG